MNAQAKAQAMAAEVIAVIQRALAPVYERLNGYDAALHERDATIADLERRLAVLETRPREVRRSAR